MRDKPRKSTDHIITPSMRRNILWIGILFILFLLGLNRYFISEDITSLTQFNVVDYFKDYFDFSKTGAVSRYEQSLFFSFFVMIQFWNLFNAKAMGGNMSAFADMKDSLYGFVFVLILILAGQILITTFGGTMFNVTPLRLSDWIIIILSTSIVLWIGEIVRLVSRLRQRVVK
jgi:Cation transport ATPase